MGLKLPFYNPQIRIRDLGDSFFLRQPHKKLVRHLQTYFGLESICLLKSARQGLKVILENLDLSERNEVIVPSFICSVVPEAVIKAGGKPVFCDVEEDSFNMDIKAARHLISKKTRAIILAHIFGIPAPINEFVRLAKEKNLVLVEDCAQAFGARYRGKLLGSFGDFAVFSFGISKNIGALGGGFLLSRSKQSFQKIEKSIAKKPYFSLKEYFEFLLIALVFNKYLYWLFEGFIEKYARLKRGEGNSKEFSSFISNLEAKVALQKLRRYRKQEEIRKKNVLIYQKELKGLLKFPSVPASNLPAFPYFPVLASQKVFNSLQAKNIPVRRVDFGGLDKDRGFQDFKFSNRNEKKVRKEYFLLPLNHSPQEIKLLAQQIKEILKDYAR